MNSKENSAMCKCLMERSCLYIMVLCKTMKEWTSKEALLVLSKEALMATKLLKSQMQHLSISLITGILYSLCLCACVIVLLCICIVFTCVHVLHMYTWAQGLEKNAKADNSNSLSLSSWEPTGVVFRIAKPAVTPIGTLHYIVGRKLPNSCSLKCLRK